MVLFPQRKPDRDLGGQIVSTDHATDFMAELWDWMKSIVIALFLILLIHQYGFQLSPVKGASMKPTIEEGEWLFVNKTAYWANEPGRGDVVVIKEPEGERSEHLYLVKRIVAVSGDEVYIQHGKLYVNGQSNEESYTDSLIEDGQFEPYTVEPGHVFVLGDNRARNASYDSRSFGAVSLNNVQGRAECIVWPIAKWGSL